MWNSIPLDLRQKSLYMRQINVEGLQSGIRGLELQLLKKALLGLIDYHLKTATFLPQHHFSGPNLNVCHIQHKCFCLVSATTL